MKNTSDSIVIEVCAGSYEDCLAAWKGGAQRVELNSALALGGLTPTTAVLKKVKADTGLEVIAMVRPRAGGFFYTSEEKQIMNDEADSLLAGGADGLAFGYLNEDSTIDEEATKKMVEKIHQAGKTAVFHRAVDVTPDFENAVQILADLGVDRVLTSGQKTKAEEGLEAIAAIQNQFQNRIEILPGSGVHAGNAQKILNTTGVSQLHSSCRGWRSDPTTLGKEVSYAYLSGDQASGYEVVDEKKVFELVKNAKKDSEE